MHRNAIKTAALLAGLAGLLVVAGRLLGGRGYDDDDDNRYDQRPEAGGHKRKRGGFLGELFELGG